MTTNDLKKWSRREVDLVISKETNKEREKDYEVAYQAFVIYLELIENSPNPEIAKKIFTQLLCEQPLIPIEDNEEDWMNVRGFDPAKGTENIKWSIYQNKRYPTLFKKVIYDQKNGEVKDTGFSDTNRAVCIDINTYRESIGEMGLLILDEMIPITMPYQPISKIRIFTENLKCHEECEDDFDTIGILYFRMPDGTMREVKRYFKEDHKTKQMVEINLTEYLYRKKKVLMREGKILKGE